jgi:hypothetical protein
MNVNPDGVAAEIHDQVPGLLGGPFPGWVQGECEDADAAGRVANHGQGAGLCAAGQAGCEEGRARIASACERRNCDQASPVRRRAGSIPLALRISRTVDAATFTPSPASSPWIRRYPSRVLAGQPPDHGPDAPPGRWLAW